MNIFPAIDLLSGKAVRLFRGDYEKATVYSEDPAQVAQGFASSGAKFMHLVDLDGARDGSNKNYRVIKEITEKTDMFIEVGGGIRSLSVIEDYLSLGVSRVILGTAAVTDRDFLKSAIDKYGDKIAVGIDLSGGYVAIRGWTEKSSHRGFAFAKDMERLGVSTIICTDISKDGAMQGANHELYEKLSKEVKINIIASGGVSSLEDIKKLKSLGLYGAIIGKAYYTGAIELAEALRVAK